MGSRARRSRRHFLQDSLALAGLGLAAGCGGLPTWTSQPTRMPRIGYLVPGSPGRVEEPLRQGLRELGYIEDQNIAIVWRWAEGKADLLPELAAELVALPVDVLVTVAGWPAAEAAKRATSTIPTIFVWVGDPVGYGLVASLAQPGGNLTGLSAAARPRQMMGHAGVQSGWQENRLGGGVKHFIVGPL